MIWLDCGRGFCFFLLPNSFGPGNLHPTFRAPRQATRSGQPNWGREFPSHLHSGSFRLHHHGYSHTRDRGGGAQTIFLTQSRGGRVCPCNTLSRDHPISQPSRSRRRPVDVPGEAVSFEGQFGTPAHLASDARYVIPRRVGDSTSVHTTQQPEPGPYSKPAALERTIVIFDSSVWKRQNTWIWGGSDTHGGIVHEGASSQQHLQRRRQQHWSRRIGVDGFLGASGKEARHCIDIPPQYVY